MRKIQSSLKLAALILSSIILFQSCRAYQSKTVTIEEATQSQKRVKVKTITNETLKFEILQQEEDQFYGITKKSSNTAKKLIGQLTKETPNHRFVKILLPADFISEIHTQNKTMSAVGTLISIAILGSVIGLIGILALFGAFGG